jgi:protein-L-isoaspartate(D-aspartate) O-methyltransferase
MRKRLVEDLRKKGISDERILDVFWRLPRHYFLDVAFDEWAYKDQAFRIDCDQTISQPYTVARQTEWLKVERGVKVLEIGTGSGYQAAVLQMLGAQVYTIERIEKLHTQSKSRLEKLGFGDIQMRHGDGFKGWPEEAPFDRILLTAAPAEVPTDLLHQLAIDGWMIVPVGEEKGDQKMYKIKRTGKNSFQRQVLGTYRFVPMRKGLE